MMKVNRAAFKAEYGIVILAIFTNLLGRDGISINSLHGNVMLAIFNPLQQKHGVEHATEHYKCKYVGQSLKVHDITDRGEVLGYFTTYL
jgi:hypothetical protein